MTPDDERFTAKVTVLIESVEHHIEEEESSWFPDVREALGRKELQEIGAQMLKLRRRAPRQPKRAKVELAEPKAGKANGGAADGGKANGGRANGGRANAGKATSAKANGGKATSAKANAGPKATPTAAKGTMPAQADVSNRPALTPPPLPGAEGSIALVDASMPGAKTQDSPRELGAERA
jgi:hypothetical protein